MWNTMTLEDFFTLTEMKDGLMVPSRVHELLSVMRKEKDSIVKNIGDVTRQWTAVASTISATENRECLDLFIQLDGFWYFDKWLKDVQNYSRGASDGFTEESITLLLRAVEKLQIDKARSLSSGIFTTVNNLLRHSCSRVQDRARSLLDSWKQNEDTKCDSQNVRVIDAVNVSGNIETATNVFLKGSDDTKRSAVELSSDEAAKSRTMNCSEVERVQDLETCNSKCVTRAILDDGSCSDKSVTESVMSNCSQAGTSLKEKISVGILDGAASTETHISSVQMGQGAEPETDAINNGSSLCDRASSIASASSQANIQEIKADTTLRKNIEAEGGDKSHNASASDDNRKAVGAIEGATDYMLAAIDRGPPVVHSNSKDDQHLDVQNIQGDEKGSRKAGVLKGTSTMKDIGLEHENKQSSNGDEKVGDVYAFSKSALDTQSSFSTNKKKSDIEFENGIVDALEVARQVTQEVEREVVNYKEPVDTPSSEKTMGNHGEEPSSPESISGKQDQAGGFPEADLSSSRNQSLKPLPDQSSQSPKSKRGSNAENNINEFDSSQLTEAVREPEVADRDCCGFDLNEEGTSDDADHPADLISTPISVVSVSRPAAASASPAAPLQFEGTLGWKGSAATSAFHPASARKVPEVDNNVETGTTSITSKQRQDWLDIDLNVSDGDDKVAELMLERKASSDMGTGKSERPCLDLNRMGDDGEAPPSNSRRGEGLFFLQNFHRSPSPASSSSSLRPSLNNFDLNDRPHLHNDSSNRGLYHRKSSHTSSLYGGSRQGDHMISIMGAKVEVGARTEVSRKDFFNQTPFMFLPNGLKPLETADDTNDARTGVMGMVPTASSYASSPLYGYSGLAPAAPTLSLSSTMYGPGGTLPYMVDSKGSAMIPQIAGTGLAAPYSQQPFVMNMAGPPLSMNGAAGPSQLNSDLNSGFSIDGGGGSSGGFRQFFITGPGRSFEERLRANPQPSTSLGMVGKRKEPEGGWEPYSLHYKQQIQQQQPPPWR